MWWIVWVVLAYFLADLITGLFHWFEDRYGNPNWPLIGDSIIRPNIEHHLRPYEFTKGNYFYRNWTTLAPSLLFALLFYYLGWHFLMLTAIFASQANEIHCWSHMRSCSLVRLFQSTGIIQSPQQHAIHHRRPFDKYFCVMTNYLNPVLVSVKFWQSMEYALSWLGINPRAERSNG